MRGFTLIETFVAISILLTALIAPLSIASQGVHSALTASDQTTAIYLAQDAIEYARAWRDHNTLSDPNRANWLSGMTACISGDGSATCRFDSTVLNFPAAASCSSDPGAVCLPLNYETDQNQPSYGYYNYNPASASNVVTKFTRTVSIKTPICIPSGACNPDQALISATVAWSLNGQAHTFTVTEDMFNLH